MEYLLFYSIPILKHIAVFNFYIFVFNPIALRKAKIISNFGHFECNWVWKCFKNIYHEKKVKNVLKIYTMKRR